MSPTSQGALEVERYIGSCLISTSAGRQGSSACRKQQGLSNKCQSQFVGNGTWAGGAPLISMAANPRRNGQRASPSQHHQVLSDQQQAHLQNRVPLSRLAVHTQGAPLILSSGRYHNNNNRAKMQNAMMGNNLQARCHPQQRLNKANDQKKPAREAASKEGAVVNVASIDSLSIASDESSGSNNSENSLPRIIKPRKRRKKDRKPPLVVGGLPTAAAASSPNDADESQQSPVVNSAHHFHHPGAEQQQHQPMKAYQSANSYENARYPSDNYYKGHRRAPNHVRENNYRPPHQSNNCPPNGNQAPMQQLSVNSAQQQQHEVIDTRQQHRNGNYAHRHVREVKVLDDNRNVILPVPVCPAKANYLRNANNNARFMHDLSEPVTLAATGPPDDCSIQASSLCQCRYCDPATLVWDVSEQSRYSPHFLAQGSLSEYRRHHHHHHHHRFSQLPATVLVARPVICQEHPNTIEFFDVENPCLRLRTASTIERSDGAAMLRRSWSDPTSYFSDEIVPNRDVGVIGDRGQPGEASKGRSSWRGDASSASAPASPGLPGPLEVSTEIVTSPNGHRDLEIKFYSSSPTTSYASSADDSKNAFTFPDDDTNDSEEFSDIWSYHESKLQQDFRTLLQAEE